MMPLFVLQTANISDGLKSSYAIENDSIDISECSERYINTYL
jgi:hypothetical protein